MYFPTVEASNLLRQQLSLPKDFQGDQNILLIPFLQRHQAHVDSWIPFLRQLETVHPAVKYYELPTIQRMNIISRTFINEGMRAGIPDLHARERTITMYLDKVSFRASLELPDEKDIFVLLSDRQGQISWKTRGSFTSEKAESLVNTIKEILLLPA